MQGRPNGSKITYSFLPVFVLTVALAPWAVGCKKASPEPLDQNISAADARDIQSQDIAPSNVDSAKPPADKRSVAESGNKGSRSATTRPTGTEISDDHSPALPPTGDIASEQKPAHPPDGSPATEPAVYPTGHSDPNEPAMLPGELIEGPDTAKQTAGEPKTRQNQLGHDAVSEDEQGSAGTGKPQQPGGLLVIPNPLRPEGVDQSGWSSNRSGRPPGQADLPAELGQAASKPAPQTGESQQPPPSRKSKRSAQPFDPIKENGPIFVGWPKPQAALVISGRQIGYLEPCGCAGLDRMKGGLGRRHTLMKTLAAKGWPAVGLDVGGVAKGFGKQAELKFATAIEGMRKMGYSVVGLGVEELRLPAGLLVSLGADTPTQPGLFVSANVALFGFEAKLTPRSRVISLGGRKIGVTAVLGHSAQKQIQSNELELAEPHKSLAEVVPDLAKQADFLVLLAYASMDEATAMAKSFPQFDLIVVAEGPSEPPDRFIQVDGIKARFVAVGEKGMNVVVVGLYDDPRQPLRYQRVPLDSRFEGSREMQMLMAAYQDQLKTLGFAGLDLRPVPHPQRQTNGNFVGPQKCQSCHEESYRIWRRSRHAIAFETLVKLDPPRHYDPECISCHVVGWHPTKYFPYQGGYQSAEKTPDLVGVGCDACHGPGEGHVQAELGSDKQLQARMREAVRITKAEAADPTSKKANCYSCHDLDNSPDFNFEEYWPDVEHYEDPDAEREK